MGTNHENDRNRPTETTKNKNDQKASDVVNLSTKAESNIKQSHTSMTSLIIWNISKALERQPYMDLQTGIKMAQERIQRVSREGNTTISQYPEEEHLVCALLAWQQLGHAHADSLYNFIMSKKIEDINNTSNSNDEKQRKTLIVTSNSINISCNQSRSYKDIDAPIYGGYSKGPVIKLPVETKIIMRVDEPPKKKCSKCKRQESKESRVTIKSQESETGSTKSSCQPPPTERKDCQNCGQQGMQDSSDTTNKINAACCMESMCSEKLTKMDAETAELRSRAERLAKREAQRSELLERAEAAWKDLERGYQRRLTLAQEKEEDITRQIQKMIDDRNGYKKACNTLAQELKGKGDAAEEVRSLLKNVEAEVCQFACQRLKLSEEATRAEAALAEQQCKTVQLQRDLQFKEEQVRRKVMTMESETESACALTHETERALRAELSGLREQISQVSKQLLEEDEVNKRLKKELDELRKEKLGMIEDLEGCKLQCDGKIKKQMDEVQAKRQQLQELKDKELECRCKVPIDASVEVKRTPSLAALCKCSPEDRLLDSCSCTSMKGRLLSNLLADLFGGLQSELGGTGSQMPCQLLKCLEDQHNWDRASVTKSNLRSYFSKLLVGELDIAIATSIENYHAKWVGVSCADTNLRMTPGPGDDLNEGWEKRAIERRAEKLAVKLAEELYEKRADELTKRAKTIVTSGPPPCECNKRGGSHHVYPCLLESATPFQAKLPETPRKGSQFDKGLSPPPPAYWKRTHHDVTQLRLEIEDLKKETIKKEDLKLMEEKITKIVQKSAGPESEDAVSKDNTNYQTKFKKEFKCARNTNTDDFLKSTASNKTGVNKKKSFDFNNSSKKLYVQEKPTKQPKKQGYHQTYAVNMCLCATQKPNKNLPSNQSSFDVKTSKQKSPKEIQSLPYNTQQTKVINNSPSDNNEIHNKASMELQCGSNCKCFHKFPSNTSIDKLLETLTKWKSDLGEESEDKIIRNVTSISKICLNKHSKSILKNKGQIESAENGQAVNESKIREQNLEVGKPNHSIKLNDVVKTASEYMTAINLDKNIEYPCNYSDSKEPVMENKQLEVNGMNICSDPLNHIQPSPTKYKNQQLNSTLIPGDNEKQEPKDAQKIEASQLYSKFNNIPKSHILTNSKNTRAINTEGNREHAPALTERVRRTDDAQNTAKLLQNLDYYVKFLGVTLVDKKPHKIVQDSVNNYHDTSLCKESYKNIDKDVVKSRTPKSSSDSSKHFADEIVLNPPRKQKNCECKAKFDELKNFIIGLLNDQVKNKNTGHKDIALDSQNITRPIETLGSCICCNTNNVDCSNDLEVNAFDLLEAHLKEKIKEFKFCSCQSSCISAEEEEKIYRTILKRVKQVISDCANELKCSETERLLGTSEGSWQRAYGLLREYLKMKIKRAQCLPLNEDKDEVLPDILDKVCNLIEHDFQRLTDLCKCEKKENFVTKIALIEPLSKPAKELPEKDIDFSTNKNDTNTISQQISIRPSIFQQSISSQVLSDVKTDTKSCDAMVRNINIAHVSIQNVAKPITQSLSSQVPLELGMATKSCHVMLDVNNRVKTVSKENFTEPSHLSLQQHVCSQVPIAMGMETKSCDAMIKADNIVKIVSRKDIANTNNVSQHMASQVPLNLGMESKCCNPMINIIQNQESKLLTSNELSKLDYHPRMATRSCDVSDTGTPPELIYNTCNCNYSHKKCSNQNFESKTVLFNLSTDVLKSSNVNNLNNLKKHIDWIPTNVIETTQSLPNLKSIENTKALLILGGIENNINSMNNDPTIINNYAPYINTPYIGTTINCNCDSSFKSCTCTKSLVQNSSNKIDHDWKQILANKNKSMKQFSYIMNSKHNDNKVCEMLYNIPICNEKDNNTCQSEDILLSHSEKQFGPIQNCENSSDKKTILMTDPNCNGQFSWFMSPHSVESKTKSMIANSLFCYDPVNESASSEKSATITEVKPSSNKLSNVLYYEPTIESKGSRKSSITLDTTIDTIKPSHDCTCDKVPLCHVKMLVENIERSLIESKCTCDSVSKICPIHSRAFR